MASRVMLCSGLRQTLRCGRALHRKDTLFQYQYQYQYQYHRPFTKCACPVHVVVPAFASAAQTQATDQLMPCHASVRTHGIP